MHERSRLVSEQVEVGRTVLHRARHRSCRPSRPSLRRAFGRLAGEESATFAKASEGSL